MSDANKGTQLLQTLASANGYIALGLQVGEMVIPLVKGAIREIRSIATGVETVDYEVLLKVDGAELDAIDKLAWDDLLAINAELAARGIPEIPVTKPAAPALGGDAAKP